MWLKHCGHCQQPYVSQKPADLSLVFCQPCISWFNQYLPMVKSYHQSHPHATVQEISLQLKIPIEFISALSRQGGLMRDFSEENKKPVMQKQVAPAQTSHAIDPRPCNVCGRAMRNGENVYCYECEQIVSKRLFSQYRKGMAPPPMDPAIKRLEEKKKAVLKLLSKKPS